MDIIREFVMEVLTESDQYVVRGGSDVLVRMASESPRDWRYEKLPKVTYFSASELVRKPRGPMDNQEHVFRRGDKLYAVDPRQFFAVPTT